MTENGSHQYTQPTDDAATITRPAAAAARPTRQAVRPGDPDREVPPGAVGEIGGRGAALMLGYFDNQAATEFDSTAAAGS